MIRERAAGPVEDVALRRDREARADAEVLDAIAAARAIVWPVEPRDLDQADTRRAGHAEALRAAAAPIVAVSPIVGGEVLKGPTAAFMDWAGLTLDAAGVAAAYGARATAGCSTRSSPTSRRAGAGGAAAGVP